MTSEVPKYLIPRVTPEAAEFFAGSVRGELRVQRCRECGLHHHYPRSLCPHCGADALEWVTASGAGTVHSFTVIRQHGIPPFKEQAPYVVALVDLDEPGARFVAQLPKVAPEDARIGMRVCASFRPASDEVAFVDFVSTAAETQPLGSAETEPPGTDRAGSRRQRSRPDRADE